MAAASRWFAESANQLAWLMFPTDCAGCGAADVPLCERCRQAVRPLVRSRVTHGLVAHSGLGYTGAPARVIRVFKEHRRTGLARTLAPALAAAVNAHAETAAVDSRVIAVPIPSTRASFRRRGYRPVELLAARAGVRLCRALRYSRQPLDQRELGRSDRVENMAGVFRARSVAGSRVLLIDDVVTTGATLADAARALNEAGATVIGAATVAATDRYSIGTEHGGTEF